jgi:ferredoxin
MPDKPSTQTPPDAPPAVYQARIGPGVQRFDAPADMTLLLAAERAGLAVVSSCRNGTCRACICRLVSGRITYRIEWPGLSVDEKQTGCMLPCVAYPLSDVVLSHL